MIDWFRIRRLHADKPDLIPDPSNPADDDLIEDLKSAAREERMIGRWEHRHEDN